jgi:hypothetical protein
MRADLLVAAIDPNGGNGIDSLSSSIKLPSLQISGIGEGGRRYSSFETSGVRDAFLYSHELSSSSSLDITASVKTEGEKLYGGGWRPSAVLEGGVG